MSAKSNQALVLGGVPRADLLPPEVHARAKSRRTRRMLAIAVISALGAVGGAYAFASLQTVSAQAELAAEQERTTELLAEQLLYSDATTMAGLVDTISEARTLGASTEVLWDDVADDLQTYLPPGAVIGRATFTARAPWEPELAPTGPLRYAPLVSRLSVGVTSLTVFDATAVVREMEQMPGFLDATPDTVTYDATEGVYATTITATLDAEALSGRFSPDEGDEGDDGGSVETTSEGEAAE